jgi:uncharacterized repeat protein (TIGR02543 family)
LTAADITITDGTGAVVKGGLTGSGTDWSIALNSVTTQGNVSVAVAAPAGYTLTGSPKTVAVYKSLSPITCTVTFDKNGGDTDASPSTKTAAFGGNVGTLPTVPTRSGYTFNGWNTAANGSGAAFTAATAVTSNITVYAQWMPNPPTPHTVSVSANPLSGGSVSGGGTYLEGSSVTVIAAANSGYSFTNWTENNMQVSTNAAYTFILGTADRNLAANFTTTPVAYTVTFDKNGGDTDASPGTKTTASGGNVGTLPTAPTRSGYTFNGWNTAADGSGTAFTAATAVTSNITVYAQWTTNSSGGNEHPSGGDSGGGANTPAVTPPAPRTQTTVSGNTSTVTTTATATVDNSGRAAAAVTQAQVNDAISQAVAAAERQGEGAAARIEIMVEAPANAKTVETSIPKEAVSLIAAGRTEGLTISTPVASITFDDKALSTIAGEAAGTVKITTSKVEASSLSAEAQQAVGDRPVFNFSITSGDRTLSQFGGNVSVSVPYTPKPGEDINAIVIYYINSEGKPEMVPNCKYDPATGKISFTTSHFSQYAVGYNKVSFRDVAADAWYNKAVGFIAARGITTGTGNGNYSPAAKLTRGEFIVMLMKAYGIAPDANPKDNFSDAGSTYYTGYLAAAKRLGISAGVGNNMYAPGKEITRQEMFTLLYNALKGIGQLPQGNSGKALTSFSDAGQIASWAKDAMALLVQTKTVGGNNGKLTPTSTTTRAEMAQVLYNLLSK